MQQVIKLLIKNILSLLKMINVNMEIFLNKRFLYSNLKIKGTVEEIQ